MRGSDWQESRSCVRCGWRMRWAVAWGWLRGLGAEDMGFGAGDLMASLWLDWMRTVVERFQDPINLTLRKA